MRNIVKSLFIVLSCLMATTVSAQTVVTWTPTQADVTALTNTSIHYVDVGSGTKSFKIYSIRPFLNNNQVKLEWDGSVNAVKMTDNGMEKAGLAIYVPTTSDNISKIVVYMHTTGSRKTYYTSGNPCPTSNPSTYTTTALATSSTGYEFWTGTLSKDMYYACGGRKDGSGESYFDKIEVTFAGLPPASNDATLSALVYGSDQTSVPNFSSSQTSYEVELPATYVGGAPSIQGTTTDPNANITNVTQATTIPGVASITVTAEDGTTTKTYTVTFTKASADPKVTSATWTNIKGTATIDQVNKTITGQVTNGSSLTAITPTFTGDNVTSWTPNTAQDFSNGAVNYTFKSSTNETTVYAVTITEAPAVSTDATLSSLTYGGKSVPNFSPNTLTYNIELTAGIKTPPTIAATPNNRSTTMQITQAQSVPGSGKVEVTAEDGETKLTYTINYTVEVPSSDLTIHVPEIYEAKEIAGGYGGTLSVFGGREYEVYYGSYTEKNDTLTITVFPTQKSSGITTSLNKTSFKATDGWFEGTAVGGKSNYTFTDLDEFKAGAGALHKLKNGNEYVFHIQGYDQFSFMGKDNNADVSKGRYLQVYIDNVLQTSNLSTSHSIRRFNITTGEHVIKIKAIHDGDSQSEICGFSLRLGQEPRTRYLKGNDSTQVVMQTAAIKPVYYVTKYNNIPGAVTELEWDGPAASGIGLTKIDGELADTLVLSGTANCATGTYHYAVVAKYNGVETSRATGTFTVKSDIKATSEIEVDVYNNETMDQITFKYYALSDNDVNVTWSNGQPAGISGSGNNGKYIIGGTPNLTGTFPQTFPYTITVNGADTIINGKITVKELNYTDKSVLYLYKNSSAYQHDDIYKYLKIKGWDLIERKALEDGLRPAEQYRNYKFIIISEDADADNAEVLAVMKSGANLPVLNLKGFTYAHQRNEDTPDGWGEPDNGAIDTIEMKGRNIKIEQPSHPIFKKMNGVSNGKEIAILDSYGQHGVMPIRVTRPGTLCLATGYTRSTSDYYEAGELQTAIHEVPADMNGGIKYICLSLSRTAVLSADGKKLIDGIVDYLTSDTQSDIDVPNCQIMTFTVAGKEGVVNHAAHSIVINMSVDEFQAADSLKNAEPVITLADPHTHVVPDSKELRYAAMGLPKKYTVTDYINLWVYEVSIRLYTPQGLEETYESGMWVNIFDIYGRKVATTNEDIYTMDLPHGMYIVVTETGSTLKIMR